MDKKYLATITILIKDRQNHAPEVNKILTDNGYLIIARLGVNLQKRCAENCTALITVVIEGNNKEIKKITDELDKLYGIVAKVNIMTE